MDKGTYAAASAGLMQFRKLDVATNNVANVNTPGFKRQLLVTDEQSFDETLAKNFEGKDPYAKGDHDRVKGCVNARTVTDFSLGSIKVTERPLDVALRNPNDFFVINTPNGPQYTRAGNFSLTAEGTLVTPDGYEVSGDGGPLTATGGKVEITPGGILMANGTQVGALQVVRVEDANSLERVGDNRFSVRQGQAAPSAVEPNLAAGSLEMGNVSVIQGMIDLVTANRGFELYTRTAQTVDGLNQAAINQIGRRS